MKLPHHNRYAKRRLLVVSVITFVCLWPMNSLFSGIRFVGAVLTPQRIIIPTMFSFVLASESNARLLPKRFLDWRTMFYAWLTWGLVTVIIGTYSNRTDAFRELWTILLSFMVVFILVNQIMADDLFHYVLSLIKWIYIGTVLFGMIEIATGFHLSTSAHFVLPGYSVDWYQPTAQFYGVNDYSAYLALFSPILIYRTEKFRSIIASVVIFLMILYIMVRNDAVISIIGTMVGLAAFLWIVGGKQPIRRKSTALLVVFLTIVAIFILFSPLPGFASPLSRAFQRLTNEYSNYLNNTGSMYARISMYKEMLKIMTKQFFIGFGPASLRQVIEIKGASLPLLDPHNYHVELVFAYGLPIYILIFICYVRIIRSNIRKYRLTGHRVFALIAASSFILPIISIAPSGFIGYQYPWLLFAIGIVTQEKIKKRID